MIWFGKLRNADGVSTLFVYYPGSREVQGTALFCISETGRESWHFVPGGTVSDFNGTYSPLYIITDFHVSALESGGPTRILVTSHHLYNDPNQLAVLDERGEKLSEYWHSGYLTHLNVEDINGNGIQEIILGGVNNGYGCATLVVLDPRKVRGASTQASGDRTQLKGFGPGLEKTVILFPRTCVGRKIQYNKVVRMDAAKGWVKVDVQETETDGAATVIYLFNGDMTLNRVIVSDHLKNIHNEMYSKGEIDHPFSESDADNLRKNIRISRGGDGR